MITALAAAGLGWPVANAHATRFTVEPGSGDGVLLVNIDMSVEVAGVPFGQFSLGIEVGLGFDGSMEAEVIDVLGSTKLALGHIDWMGEGAGAGSTGLVSVELQVDQFSIGQDQAGPRVLDATAFEGEFDGTMLLDLNGLCLDMLISIDFVGDFPFQDCGGVAPERSFEAAVALTPGNPDTLQGVFDLVEPVSLGNFSVSIGDVVADFSIDVADLQMVVLQAVPEPSLVLLQIGALTTLAALRRR